MAYDQWSVVESRIKEAFLLMCDEHIDDIDEEEEQSDSDSDDDDDDDSEDDDGNENNEVADGDSGTDPNSELSGTIFLSNVDSIFNMFLELAFLCWMLTKNPIDTEKDRRLHVFQTSTKSQPR